MGKAEKSNIRFVIELQGVSRNKFHEEYLRKYLKVVILPIQIKYRGWKLIMTEEVKSPKRIKNPAEVF